MKIERKNKILKLLETISSDMENSARRFEGSPFNEITVAEYFVNQGVAITTLTRIIKAIMVEE